MKTARMAVTMLMVGGALVAHAAQAQAPGITRTDLRQHDLSVPGRQAVTGSIWIMFAPDSP